MRMPNTPGHTSLDSLVARNEPRLIQEISDEFDSEGALRSKFSPATLSQLGDYAGVLYTLLAENDDEEADEHMLVEPILFVSVAAQLVDSPHILPDLTKQNSTGTAPKSDELRDGINNIVAMYLEQNRHVAALMTGGADMYDPTSFQVENTDMSIFKKIAALTFAQIEQANHAEAANNLIAKYEQEFTEE